MRASHSVRRPQAYRADFGEICKTNKDCHTGEICMPRYLAAVAIGVVLLATQSAQAQSVEEFYKGRRITITVGYGPGGGYDVFARLVARDMGKYLPGRASLI